MWSRTHRAGGALCPHLERPGPRRRAERAEACAPRARLRACSTSCAVSGGVVPGQRVALGEVALLDHLAGVVQQIGPPSSRRPSQVGVQDVLPDVRWRAVEPAGAFAAAVHADQGEMLQQPQRDLRGQPGGAQRAGLAVAVAQYQQRRPGLCGLVGERDAHQPDRGLPRRPLFRVGVHRHVRALEPQRAVAGMRTGSTGRMSSVQSMKSTPVASPGSGTGTCGPAGCGGRAVVRGPFRMLEPRYATGGRIDGPSAHEDSKSPNATKQGHQHGRPVSSTSRRGTPVSLGLPRRGVRPHRTDCWSAGEICEPRRSRRSDFGYAAYLSSRASSRSARRPAATTFGSCLGGRVAMGRWRHRPARRHGQARARPPRPPPAGPEQVRPALAEHPVQPRPVSSASTWSGATRSPSSTTTRRRPRPAGGGSPPGTRRR